MSTTKYTEELLRDAVSKSTSCAGVLRHLGLRQAGGTQAYISSRIKMFDIDTSHFTNRAWNKGMKFPFKKTASDILIVLPEGGHRPKRAELLRALLEVGLTYQCSGCYNDGTWGDKPLTLEIDHVDGDWLNNLRSNLRFLCPNCHSQCDGTNIPHKYR